MKMSMQVVRQVHSHKGWQPARENKCSLGGVCEAGLHEVIGQLVRQVCMR